MARSFFGAPCRMKAIATCFSGASSLLAAPIALASVWCVRWLHLPIRPYLGGWTRGSPFRPYFFFVPGITLLPRFPAREKRGKGTRVESQRLTGRLKQPQFLKNANYKLEVAADA